MEKAFDIDRFALKEQYPCLRAFVETDCANPPVGIEGLRMEIAAADIVVFLVSTAFLSSDYIGSVEKVSPNERQERLGRTLKKRLPNLRRSSLARSSWGWVLRLKQLPDIPTVVDDSRHRIVTGSIRLLRPDNLVRINVHGTVENAAV